MGTRVVENGSISCVNGADAVVDVQKIRTRQLESPLESETLQDLVLNELKTKKHTASEGLLWLVRYGHPTCLPFPHDASPLISAQRPRLHRPSITAQPHPIQRRALGLVPRRVRQDAGAAPLVPRQARLLRRHERLPLSQGLLSQARS